MKKKGFTLLELLAVIIILAVIALITTPIVLNVVDEAKKSAFQDSTYGLIDAIGYKSLENVINGNSRVSTYTFPSTDIKVQGTQPSGGTASVDKDGKIQIAVHNGKWCATKDYTDSKITITDYVEGECFLESSIETYEVGDAIYYNPETNAACSDYTEEQSETGVNSGCMKWYVYNADENGYSLILDHNLTENMRASIYADGDNSDNDMLFNRLEAETVNWKIDADVLDYDELEDYIEEYNENIEQGNYEPIAVPEYFSENGGNYWTKAYVNYNGDTRERYVIMDSAFSIGYATNPFNLGVRPVIKVNKRLKGTPRLVETVQFTLSGLATTSENVESIPECVLNKTVCDPGTQIALKVNHKTVKDFYVVSDDGTTVTLLMNKSVVTEIPWASYEDYVPNENIPCSVYTSGYGACSNLGPITAVKYLDLYTSGWTYIESKPYTYSGTSIFDEQNSYDYSFTKTMKARMLTVSEATSPDLGCTSDYDSCEPWVQVDYVDFHFLAEPYPGEQVGAYALQYGQIGRMGVYSTSHPSGRWGVRPVIEIGK